MENLLLEGVDALHTAYETLRQTPDSPSSGDFAPPEIKIRRRFRAPPIEGRGEPRTFKVHLHEDGETRIFLVAAFSRRQAAELMNCSEGYLKQFGKPADDAERDRAEPVPGQVWVRRFGTLSYVKWQAQKGVIWG